MPPSPPPPPSPRQVPWGRKEARAVFRGKTTNFELEDGNWGASPRILLHRLSDAHPTLMDARISTWSHADPRAQEEMSRDGIHLAEPMTFEQINSFKYQVRGQTGLVALLTMTFSPGQ